MKNICLFTGTLIVIMIVQRIFHIIHGSYGTNALDVRPGITAGKSAGMEVVAVPSIPKQSHLYTLADEVINSLLDLQPEKWGLPPFQDCKAQKTA